MRKISGVAKPFRYPCHCLEVTGKAISTYQLLFNNAIEVYDFEHKVSKSHDNIPSYEKKNQTHGVIDIPWNFPGFWRKAIGPHLRQVNIGLGNCLMPLGNNVLLTIYYGAIWHHRNQWVNKKHKREERTAREKYRFQNVEYGWHWSFLDAWLIASWVADALGPNNARISATAKRTWLWLYCSTHVSPYKHWAHNIREGLGGR